MSTESLNISPLSGEELAFLPSFWEEVKGETGNVSGNIFGNSRNLCKCF